MALTLEYVRSKSAARLSGLNPVVAAAASALIDRCYAREVYVIITQGLRTYAEQDALFAQGRTKPGKIVTKARGGESNHNFGVAIDFALLLADGRSVSWDTLRDADKDSLPDWSEVVEEAKKLGFAWGGDWRSFKDMPHLEMTFGLSTAQLRAGRRPTTTQIDAAYKRIKETEGDNDVIVTKASVTVDGKPAKDGVIIDGSVYVPLRDVGERLGAVVAWDNKTKVAVVTTKGAK
ncbi:peptidoglycan L-alanyl-D-glutamate endopeptidase CwlK [Fontibacillus phaseoli]|uniref:Peptidoglycan L-alanyl-D-glutamate endopeptidase CwlK n=1 Tax=Fontibacillus phaseoli TaxID=1416533 RepID=A0A369BNK0_9BACL|nr:M15 family metallopeptidase [Fontibacillus phaseoli]RCX22971.1 peptidoglycan L-alanyl-D-glutamate endopeptidase CwlK [Fontibacillus phaseoli]